MSHFALSLCVFTLKFMSFYIIFYSHFLFYSSIILDTMENSPNVCASSQRSSYTRVAGLTLIWFFSCIATTICAKYTLDCLQSPLIVGLSQIVIPGVIAHCILRYYYSNEGSIKLVEATDIALIVKMSLFNVGIMTLLNVALLLCDISVVE